MYPEQEQYLPAYESSPGILEGAEIFDTICPISEETGLRENALSLLNKVMDPSKQDLLREILQRVPTMQSEIAGMPDDEALDLLSSRFDQGTRYENDRLRSMFEQNLNVLFPERASRSEGTIDFSPQDNPEPAVEPSNV